MSTQDDVRRTLREQADGIETARPLTFDDVRGRAHRIRRRRAGGVAAGVALVAAVVLPVALLGGAGGDRSGPDPATPSPSRAIDHSAGLPTLQDGVIIYPDGPRIPLQLDDGETASGFAPIGDRFAVTLRTRSGRDMAAVYDASGHRSELYQSTPFLAVGDKGNAVAWAAADGTVQLLVADGKGPRVIGKVVGDAAHSVAITGTCARGCDVLVDTVGHLLGTTWSVSGTGAVGKPAAALPSVDDASTDGALLAGLDRLMDDNIRGCGGVYDVRLNDFLWHQCGDVGGFSFSPDDSLVVSRRDGDGSGIQLRDSRSGTTVAELTGGGLITSYAWEDATHLLAVVVADDGSTSVQRIGTAGTETVLDGFHTDDPSLGVPVILPSQ